MTMTQRPAQTLIPAQGPRRRLQALRLLGWTTNQLAHLTGLHPNTIRQAIHPRRKTVSHDTATRITTVFDRFWDRPPRPRTALERRTVVACHLYALEQGWAPAMAWDDIDADEAPQGIPEGPEAAIPVAEALTLLKAGEAPHDVAARFGVKPESLARRLRRHGQHRWAAACERKGM